jgi:hypothetical protein
MANGYTHPVLEGCSFEEYVWGCARAVGPFISQRDDPMDAPPVLEEQVDEYYTDALNDAIRDEAAVKARTPEDWQAEYEQYCQRRVSSTLEMSLDARTKQARYQAMLERVRAWQPPSKDHQPLKQLMDQMLVDSMQHDFRQPGPAEPPVPLEEFRQMALEMAARGVEWARARLTEEQKRVEFNNRYKKQLLESVPLPEKLCGKA